MSQYIRADRRGDKTYWWLVESHREGKRVIQTRLEYLGTRKPTLEEAKWCHAFGSKEKAKKTAPKNKSSKPEAVTTAEWPPAYRNLIDAKVVNVVEKDGAIYEIRLKTKKTKDIILEANIFTILAYYKKDTVKEVAKV